MTRPIETTVAAHRIYVFISHASMVDRGMASYRIIFSFPVSTTAVMSGIVIPVRFKLVKCRYSLNRMVLPVSAMFVAMTIFLVPSGGTRKAFS